MAAADELIIQQIDSLLSRAGIGPGAQAPNFVNLTVDRRIALVTAWTTGIERLAPPSSGYRAQISRSLDRVPPSHPQHLQALVGILNALRADYEAGFMASVEELIHADVFADFLGMAGELLDKRFKDPAAVLAGSVLEEHLRKLCARHGVLTENSDGAPRKADSLSADLVKASAYGKLDQKSVTAWLGLRNDAAHGHYDRYTQEQVALMLEGVRNFLTRHSA